MAVFSDVDRLYSGLSVHVHRHKRSYGKNGKNRQSVSYHSTGDDEGGGCTQPQPPQHEKKARQQQAAHKPIDACAPFSLLNGKKKT